MITIAPLRSILEERDTNIEQFSLFSGIPLSTLKLMNKGKCITSKNVDKICATLDVQPKDILVYTETDPKGHWVFVEGK